MKDLKFNLFHVPKRMVISLIRAYQGTRILRAPSCRFYPSCSEYTAGCVSRHGLIKGLILSVARILRCHPFNAGGIDEVPHDFKMLALFGKKQGTDFQATDTTQ